MDWRIVQIAPHLLVATSELYLTTTTVVAAPDGGCLVIDPAVTVADLGALTAELTDLGLTPVAGFATHPHWDHVLWSAGLGDVPRYASARAARAAADGRAALIAEAEAEAPGHDAALTGRLTALPPDATLIPWFGPPAEVISHDGHAPGHAAVFLKETGVLVAGDMLSDTEIPLLDTAAADPVGDYLTGLDRLTSLPGVRLVVPGHGHVAGPAEFRRRAEWDRRYLDKLAGGERADDPRLSQDWLRQAHQAQLSRVRPEG